ncbi:hypothetical protein JL720_17379 [Aureococcus anophagefferens]|nr:hypothetical protein JL720_17379 [Aureococcus anophagefferens]
MSALTNYDRFAGIGDDEEAEEAARPPARRDAPRQRVDDHHRRRRLVRAPTPAPAPKPKPAGGIDYSRWDHLDDSESDGEPNRYIEDDVFRERGVEGRRRGRADARARVAKDAAPAGLAPETPRDTRARAACAGGR